MEKIRYAFEINQSKTNDADKLMNQIVKVRDYLSEKHDINYKDTTVKVGWNKDQFIRNKTTVVIDYNLLILTDSDWIGETDPFTYNPSTGRIEKCGEEDLI